jgi:hypothetical protein
MMLIPTMLVLGIDLAKMEFIHISFLQAWSMRTISYKGCNRSTRLHGSGLILKLTIYCFMASYALSGVFQQNHTKACAREHRAGVFRLHDPDDAEIKRYHVPCLRQGFPFVILPFTFIPLLYLLIVYLMSEGKGFKRELLARKKAADALSDAICFLAVSPHPYRSMQHAHRTRRQ